MAVAVRAPSFNPRPHAGGDRGVCAGGAASAGFNPRPHAGGDGPSTSGKGGPHVSIHAPTQGATLTLTDVGISAVMFQSTPPRRGRRRSQRQQGRRPGSCFNPRPHAGGDMMTRGRWRRRFEFQSTPPRRGRQSLCLSTHRIRSFNPRPHAGGDFAAGRIVAQDHVSIHAPTQGATQAGAESALALAAFQSTPPRRGRPKTRRASTRSSGFQSTPPRRGRLTRRARRHRTTMFQSTPPRRGRPVSATDSAVAVLFQSTPPRRGRHGKRFNCRTVVLFQSTPPRRGRPHPAPVTDVMVAFQSTPPRRGRPSVIRTLRHSAAVSIHAPTQGATRSSRRAR